MTTTLNYKNNKVEILDGIHYETNTIKEFILSEMDDEFHSMRIGEEDFDFSEVKNQILDIIFNWSNFDYWSTELIYNSKLLKFYEEHSEFIDNFLYEQSEEQGISYTQLLDSMNHDGIKITDVDDIKISSTIYTIECNSFTLHDELYQSLKEEK